MDDDLLNRSAPPVAARTAELAEDLRTLVRATEPGARRRRRTARATLGAGLAVGVLGFGVVGAAAVINDGTRWFTTSSSGDPCQMEFSFEPVGPEFVPTGERMAPLPGRQEWPSVTEQEVTVEEARLFMADFDFDTIDEEAAIRSFDAEQRRIIAAAPPGEGQPLMVGNDLETFSVAFEALDRMSDHLESEGLDVNALKWVIGSTNGCSE